MIWLVMIDANQTLIVIYSPSSKPFLHLHHVCTTAVLTAQNDQICVAKASRASSMVLCQCLRLCLDSWKYSYKCWKCSAFPPVESYYLLAASGGKQAFVDWVLIRAEQQNINDRYICMHILAHAYTVLKHQQAQAFSLHLSLYLDIFNCAASKL